MLFLAYIIAWRYCPNFNEKKFIDFIGYGTVNVFYELFCYRGRKYSYYRKYIC